MEKLPDDLKMEIFLHLPIKSLARFKSVSKSWLSLISEPYFTKLHFQRSSQHTHRFPYSVNDVDNNNNIHQQMRSIDINASLHDDSTTINVNFPSNNVAILCSCRGFLLLQHTKEEKLVIWNPSTGEQKHISLPLPWTCFELHSFCYDESKDDYLIVLASSDPDSSSSSQKTLGFHVFSVRTNSWDKLSLTCPATTITRYQGLGAVVNGAIHWLVWFHEAPQQGARIISFDIKTKSLREVSKPDVADLRQICYLRAFGESLTLINFKRCEISVWEMKEYGVNKSSSWTKIRSLSRSRSNNSFYFSPLCLTKDGQLVTLHHKIGLSKWSKKGERLELRKYQGYLSSWLTAAAVYTETLLSLPS